MPMIPVTDPPVIQVSPPDARDRILTPSAAPRGAAKTDHLLAHKRGRRIQHGGTCGGQGAAFVIGAAYDIAGLPCPELSGAGLWALGQLLASADVDVSMGTWPRYIFWIASHRGAPTQAEHAEDLLAPPNARCLGSMETVSISYEYIKPGIFSSLVDGIEEAILRDMPTLLSGTVGTVQGDLVDGGVIGEESLAYAPHVMAVDGVTYSSGQRLFRIRDWQPQRQFFWATDDFFKRMYEAWAVRAAV